MLKEWPLVAFTILGQTAVGVFVLFHTFFLLYGRPQYGVWRVTWLISLGIVVALLATAAFVSFFHLHHPLRARYALSNLRTSWLSREILFELGFLALAALVAFLAWKQSAWSGLIPGLIIAACLAGGFFLVSMAKLYMLPALPAWSDAYTPLSFFLTTLILGAMGTEIIVRVGVGPGAFEYDLLLGSFFLVLIDILLAIFTAPRHGIYGVRPGPSLRPVDESPRLLHGARVSLLAAGLVFIGVDFLTGIDDKFSEEGPSPALILAFVFILLGEVAGRFHFYGLVARPGR